MRKLTATLCLTIAVLLGSAGVSFAQTKNTNDIATLYKDSVIIRNARILIATFNSGEKSYGAGIFDYNWKNCITAARFFPVATRC